MIQLVTIMVGIVAVLTILAGVTVVLGVRRDERVAPILFFLAAIGAALWAISITVFLNLPAGAVEIAPFVVAIIYTSAILMVVAIFGYVSRFLGFGYVLTSVFAVLGLALSSIIIALPDFLYEGIVLGGENGNVVNLRLDWLYIVYIAFFAVVTFCYLGILLSKLFKKLPTITKRAYVMLLVGLSITGMLSLCFDLILPFFRYDLIWVGPLSVGVVIICFYYATLRYKLVMIVGKWLKILSYIVVMSTVALVYLVLFYLLSVLVFRASSPSSMDLLMNFVMIAIVFLSMPMISEMTANIRSLLSVNTVDVGYIVKKLRSVGSSKVDLDDLASFLADHLHFSYVGFLVNEKLHNSKEVEFSEKDIEIKTIQTEAYDAAQICEALNQKYVADGECPDLRVIIDLHNADGAEMGRIIFGVPQKEGEFEKSDMMQLDMIIHMISVALGSADAIKK